MVNSFLSTTGWRFALMVLFLPLFVRAADPLNKVSNPLTPKLTSFLVNDTDGDGVADEQDLCPGTPVGTAVNVYGCPLSLTTCDYTTTSFTLTSAGGSGSGTVQYVLADSVGSILQVSNTPSFSGLSGSHTYMALSVSHDGSVANLSAGQALSAVTVGCFDWSDALAVKVCVAVTPPCDYTVGATITLTASGGNATAGSLTRYVLVNSAGTIVQLSNTPSFSTTGLTAGTFAVYALVYTDDSSIVNLQTGSALIAVQANCLSLSSPLSIVLCSGCDTAKCLPIQVTVIRQGR